MANWSCSKIVLGIVRSAIACVFCSVLLNENLVFSGKLKEKTYSTANVHQSGEYKFFKCYFVHIVEIFLKTKNYSSKVFPEKLF